MSVQKPLYQFADAGAAVDGGDDRDGLPLDVSGRRMVARQLTRDGQRSSMALQLVHESRRAPCWKASRVGVLCPSIAKIEAAKPRQLSYLIPILYLIILEIVVSDANR